MLLLVFCEPRFFLESTAPTRFSRTDRMTTKTDITLPPLPTFEQAESACEKGEDGPLERFIYENEPADTEATVARWRESIRSVMYAAVEADRQDCPRDYRPAASARRAAQEQPSGNSGELDSKQDL